MKILQKLLTRRWRGKSYLAAFMLAATAAATAWSATPLAVWNGDFNTATTRNGVTFDANGNTVNEDDGTVTISSSGSGGIKFTVDRTYNYITTVFTVKNLNETAESDRVLVALGGSTGYYTGVYLKSGGLSTGGVNGNYGAWGTTTYDGTVSSVADANTTRTFAATQVNAGTLRNGFHLYEDVGNGTSGGTIVYGGNGDNGLYGTQTYDKVLIGGGLSGSTGSLGSMTDLVVVSVAIYVSDTIWPLDSAGRQNFAMPGSFPVSNSTSISVLNSLLTQASISDPMFVNLGANVYLTADAKPASNLVFPNDATIAVDGTTLTVTGGMPVKLGSSITAVEGSGVVVAVGATDIDALPSGAFSSDAWTGTVWLKGRTGWSNFDPTAYGNAGSTLRFSGIQGHFSKKQCLLADTPAIELENDSYTYALNLNNGYSFNFNGGWSYVHTSELKGSGILQCDGSGGALIVVSSKWSDFTGSLKMANKTIWFGYETAPVSETDYTPGTVSGGIRVASGKKFTIPGDMTNWNVAGGYFGPGTIEISSHNSTSDVPVYLLGTDAETTIVLKGLTGTHHVKPFDDHTISAKVQLDGAVTINSGSTGRTYTFSRLTGSGNFTNTFNEYFVFNDVSEYTGVLSCNKDSYKITAGLPTTPAVGAFIAKVDSSNNKVSTLVSLAGAAGALTGELKTVDGTYGLYAVAKATVGSTGYPTVAAALNAATASDAVVLNMTGETVSVDSISVASLTVNGTGTINVTGDVTVVEAINVADAALNVTGSISATTLAMNATNIDGRNRMNAASGNMPGQTSVTATSINAQVSGSGKVTTTAGTVLLGGDSATRLVGNISAADVTISGTGTTTLYGVNAISGTVTVSAGSTVALGNPYSLGTAVRNYDAANSVITVEDGYVTAVTDLVGGSTTCTPTAASVVTVVENDNSLFGGRKVFLMNTARFQDGAKTTTVHDMTTFLVWKHGGSAATWITPLNDSASSGGNSYQITTGNGSTSYYKFRNGNNNYSDQGFIFSNGATGNTFSSGEQCLTVCGNWMLNTNGDKYMQFGSANSGSAIAEILIYNEDFTHDERAAIEAFLMAKWGIGSVTYAPLGAAAVVMQAGSTLDLGGLTQTVASLDIAGTIQNGTLVVTGNNLRIAPATAVIAATIKVSGYDSSMTAPAGFSFTDNGDGTATLVDNRATATLTWTATENGGNWGDAVNWDLGVAPGSGNAVVFPSGEYTVYIDTATAACAGMAVNGTVEFAQTGKALDVHNVLKLYSAVTGSGIVKLHHVGVENQSGAAIAFSPALVIEAPTANPASDSWFNTAAFEFGGNVTVEAGGRFIVYAAKPTFGAVTVKLGEGAYMGDWADKGFTFNGTTVVGSGTGAYIWAGNGGANSPIEGTGVTFQGKVTINNDYTNSKNYFDTTISATAVSMASGASITMKTENLSIASAPAATTANHEIVVSTDSTAGTTTYADVDNSTSTWKSTVSAGSWKDAANWENGCVPSSYTDVVFPAGTYTVYISDHNWDPWSERDKAKGMTVNGNVTLQKDGGGWNYLSLYGNIGGSGTLKLTWTGIENFTGSEMTIGCNVEVVNVDSHDSYLNQIADNGYRFTGDVTLHGWFQCWENVAFAGTLTIDTASALTIGSDDTLAIANLVVTAGTAAQITGGTSAAITGTVTLQGTDSTLTVPANANVSGATFVCGVNGYKVVGPTENVYSVAVDTNITPGGTSIGYDSKADATAAAAGYTVVLTAAQEEQGLQAGYYKTNVAYDSATGKWVVTAALDESVVGGNLVETAAVDVSTGKVTLGAANLKPGLCYRIVSGNDPSSMKAEDEVEWSDYYNGSNAPTLSAKLPTGSATATMYYSVEASDTK